MAESEFPSDEYLAEMFPDPKAFARAKLLYSALDVRYKAWKESLLEPETTHDEWAALATAIPSNVLHHEYCRREARTRIDNMPQDVLAAELEKRNLGAEVPSSTQIV